MVAEEAQQPSILCILVSDSTSSMLSQTPNAQGATDQVNEYGKTLGSAVDSQVRFWIVYKVSSCAVLP